ncbi:hypothetical protein NM688_g4440 [Phlebia brevispora]|uniref:Uncharacterized protein n=1 Tax=Phlebia brevispora TaxID=194682 RepID=A0ACC1T2L8_9APHY|nr:hypothetical protein NM688_g4440 [Phlebia brevispora]
MRLHKDSVAGILLDSAGLVALADLPSIKQRTALMGSASFFDLLFLAPGIHTQQDCTAVNGGEPPQAVDMLGDYVFRIENPATVSFLQGIGKPGHLVTVQVDSEERSWYLRHFEHLYIGGFFPSLLYFLGIALTIVSIALLGAIHDYWAMAVLLMLLVARATNTIAVMTRSREGWTARQSGRRSGVTC